MACGLACFFFTSRRLASRSGLQLSFAFQSAFLLLVTMEELSYPFPFRTRKSRAPSPRVVRLPDVCFIALRVGPLGQTRFSFLQKAISPSAKLSPKGALAGVRRPTLARPLPLRGNRWPLATPTDPNRLYLTLCDSDRPYNFLLIPKLQLPLQPFLSRGTFAAPFIFSHSSAFQPQ